MALLLSSFSKPPLVYDTDIDVAPITLVPPTPTQTQTPIVEVQRVTEYPVITTIRGSETTTPPSSSGPDVGLISGASTTTTSADILVGGNAIGAGVPPTIGVSGGSGTALDVPEMPVEIPGIGPVQNGVLQTVDANTARNLIDRSTSEGLAKGQALMDQGVGMIAVATATGMTYVNAATGMASEAAAQAKEAVGQISAAIKKVADSLQQVGATIEELAHDFADTIGMSKEWDQTKELDEIFGYRSGSIFGQGQALKIPAGTVALGLAQDTLSVSNPSGDKVLDYSRAIAEFKKTFPDAPWDGLIAFAAKYNKYVAGAIGYGTEAKPPVLPTTETPEEYAARVAAENTVFLARYAEQRSYEAKAAASWLQAQTNWNVAESVWLREKWPTINTMLNNTYFQPLFSTPGPRTSYSGKWWGGIQAVSPAEMDSFEGFMLANKYAPTGDAKKNWVASIQAQTRDQNTVALIEWFASKRGITGREYAGWLIKFDMIDPARLPQGYLVDVAPKPSPIVEVGIVEAVNTIVPDQIVSEETTPSGSPEPTVEEIEAAVWGPQPNPFGGPAIVPEIDPAKVPEWAKQRTSPYLWGVWGSK